MKIKQPKKRSKVRIFLGKNYYCFRRYIKWYFGSKKYADEKQNEKLKYTMFSHKTPLFRELKDVDMWLQDNKINNLKIAVPKINKIIIRPGETFSYWKLIGNTTKRKGYKKGMELFYGKVTTGYGGGLCQLSNLIYWMTLHTPLKVTERYRHSYDVFPDSNRKQPFGSGATCVYNYVDLQIENTTNQDFQIIVYLTDNHLVGEWRSNTIPIYNYKVYEKEHHFNREYWGGYTRHNTIHRKVYNLKGIELRDEFITENHALTMYEPMLEEKVN